MSPDRLPRGQVVRIKRAKATKPDLVYRMTVEHDDGDHVEVIGPFSGAVPLDLGYVTFDPDDIFTEHFWRTRWYSIAAVHDSRMQPKGWYCDVARPAVVTADAIVSEDLELDLWKSATRSPALVLDVDEFHARCLYDNDRNAHDAAHAALDELAAAAEDHFGALLFRRRPD